ISDCLDEFLCGGNRRLAGRGPDPVLAWVDLPEDIEARWQRFGDADVVEGYRDAPDSFGERRKTLKLWPADGRMGDQEVIDAGVREDLRLGKRSAGQPNGAVGHLELGHVGALVSLCVRAELDVMVGGEFGHARQVALDDL